MPFARSHVSCPGAFSAVLVVVVCWMPCVPPGLYAQVRTPPRVIELRPFSLPEGMAELPAEQLQATIVVDEHGVASIEQTDAPAPISRLMAEALSQGRFAPAHVDGKPVKARVKLRFGVAGAAPSPASVTVPKPAAPQPQPAREVLESPQIFEAVARLPRSPPTVRRLELVETRDLPGAFGDPFRVINSLPGVVPMFSGLPFVYVRGAPPAGTVYYYDEVQIPALFHLGVGPSVIHPHLLGPVDFYPGVPQARFGRRTGGVLAGRLPEPSGDAGWRGELELRALDVNGMVEVPLLGGRLFAAGRYGYPGLLLSLFSPNAYLSYADYQTRLELPLSPSDKLLLTWFGSHDAVGSGGPNSIPWRVALQFHRLEARLLRRRERFEFGGALQFGFDHSALNEAEVRAARIGSRLWAIWRLADRTRVRVGADMLAATGRIREDEGEIARERFLNRVFTSVTGRNMGGSYVELNLPLGQTVELDAGLRGDFWLSGSQLQRALEPRLTLSLRPRERFEVHAAAGLAHQPAVFLIPLPGVTDVALDSGLQRAVQAELGALLELDEELSLEVTGYLNSMSNAILPSLVIENADRCDPFGLLNQYNTVTDVDFCQERQGLPRARSLAYGVELFFKRPSRHRFSGWLAYTLGRAQARAPDGLRFTPQFDVRHVFNWVVRYRPTQAISVGTRLHVRSGRMASALVIQHKEPRLRKEQRLPAFARADAQMDYQWHTSWGRMQLSLEWFNLTAAAEPIGIDCNDRPRLGVEGPDAPPCSVNYAPKLLVPNLGLRGTF
ncbi:MAG: Plug domain-containing protein [Proteobacteria bacterium]|nr:Plug domain-containing protein [Pseudomonadota bacterium]